MTAPRHVLVFRFSAMGDVAMTVPVIRLLLKQHPGLQVTFVSNGFLRPLFSGIDRLAFYPADLKGKHNGLKGLFRLYKELRREYSFDAVADLHNVLRTQVIRKFFSFSSLPVTVVDKGRREKKALTRKNNKVMQQLPSTFSRYAAVFDKLGLPVDLTDSLKPLHFSLPDGTPLSQWKKEGYKMVGIAPFASYAEKTYPAEKMKEVINSLMKNKVKVVLFGGGKEEINQLGQWEKELPGVINMAGKISFEEELHYISQLDAMVSMDSANMHLASMYGVPVVSVWGATHPYAGFYGWRQASGNAAQLNLPCRPCSVFGNKPCYRGDLACMNQLLPEIIYQKLQAVLDAN